MRLAVLANTFAKKIGIYNITFASRPTGFAATRTWVALARTIHYNAVSTNFEVVIACDYLDAPFASR